METDPKADPSCNLSLVLHQLAKAPFEPIKGSSLKHLTFKTVFLLALGSGKCRSEIHAWQNRNIRHQSDWSKVSLYPSTSFLYKKHCTTFWTGPQTSGKIRRWFLSPFRKVSTKTSHLPLSPQADNPGLDL